MNVSKTEPFANSSFQDYEALEAERHEIALNLLRDQRTAMNPEAIMLAAATAVGSHLGIARAGFFELIDPDTMHFTVEWSSGALPVYGGVYPAIFLGPGMIQAARTGKTIPVCDVRTDEVAAGSAFEQMGTLSTIAAPILRDGEWVAGLYTNHTEPRAWTASDLRFVQMVADQTWMAVTTARAQTASAFIARELSLALDAADLGHGTSIRKQAPSVEIYERPIYSVSVNFRVPQRCGSTNCILKIRSALQANLPMLWKGLPTIRIFVSSTAKPYAG